MTKFYPKCWKKMRNAQETFAKMRNGYENWKILDENEKINIGPKSNLI